MMTFFIILQFLLLLFMLFHDWISIPPLNDIQALKQAEPASHRLLSTMINAIVVLIPLTLTLLYYSKSYLPFSVSITLVFFYIILTIGTVLSWWVPYIYGSSQEHKQHFSRFKNTHHFLPARADHVIPNTLHVLLHLQVWLCLGISLYFLVGNLTA